MTTLKRIAITAAALCGFLLWADWYAGGMSDRQAAIYKGSYAERDAARRDDQRLAWMSDSRQVAAWNSCRGVIEGMLRYDHDWLFGGAVPPGSTERHGTRKVDFANYTITYSGDRLKAQNGFGAWAKMRYGCKWHANLNKVEVLYLETAVQ